MKAHYDKLVTAARNRSIAVAFLKRADRRAYGKLWTELENQYTRGNGDQYPLDLTAAYNLLLNYKGPRDSRIYNDDYVTGVQFMQQGGATVGGTDSITHERIACFTCQNKGHYSDACPDAVIVPEPVADVPVVQLLQVEIA